MPIIVNLDIMMARRKISLGELAEKIDLTPGWPAARYRWASWRRR